MRAMQVVDWGKPLELREYPDPEPQGREVLVKVQACGVCHSDVHVWDGFFDLGDGKRITLESRGARLPFTMGHEIVGAVMALGPEAAGVAPGDKVVVYPWIGCGDCAVCRRGDELLCVNPHTLGARRAGGYGDRLIVRDSRYLVRHDSIDRDLAATYTCSGITAYSALKKAAHIRETESLVMIGAGGVSGNGVHMAPALIKGRIVVCDIDPAKRALARQMGAHETVDNARPDAVKAVLDATGGGAAAAIDFVGSPATMQFGMDVLAKGGKLVMVGLYGGSLPVSTPLFPLKMLTVEGSYVGTLDDLKELVALVQAGRVPPLPIERRPLAQATEALNDLRQGGRVLGRVVLQHG